MKSLQKARADLKGYGSKEKIKGGYSQRRNIVCTICKTSMSRNREVTGLGVGGRSVFFPHSNHSAEGKSSNVGGHNYLAMEPMKAFRHRRLFDWIFRAALGVPAPFYR